MNQIRRYIIIALLSGMIAVAISSCATVGREFSTDGVPQIQMNVTTRADILRIFGQPWRIGVEDGLKTWTYGHYRYSIMKEPNTSDLIIRFNDKDIVASYSYSTNDF